MAENPVQRLVEQFQAGVNPEESFRGIFQLYHSRVEAFFRRKGIPSGESKDLTQETFLQVFKALPSFRHDSSFPVWLFGVMKNVYRNQVRKRGAEKRDRVEVSIDASGYEGGPSLEPATEEEDLVARLILQERSKALRAALEDLPEQMRLCCRLRYERGYKYQEIARVMDISIETVKAHLHQATKRLTIILGSSGLP